MNLIHRLLVMIGLASAPAGTEPELKSGKCWAYTARSIDEGSYLVIRKIETLPRIGEVAHISVYNLSIKNPASPSGFADQAGHIPISVSALRESLTKELDMPVPETNWMEGYSLWREAYETGRGGVFTNSVSECVGILEEALNRN
jgi:hypothetical protein